MAALRKMAAAGRNRTFPAPPLLRVSLSHPPHSQEWRTLIDLSTLHVVPKAVRPLAQQHPNESRKLWEHVTNHLLKKEFGEATRAKLTIEQKQRDLAAERKKKGVEYVAPRARVVAVVVDWLLFFGAQVRTGVL